MALGDDMTSGICSVQGSERTDRRAPDDKAPAGKHETCAACVICHLAGPAPAPLPVTIPPVSIALIARPTPPREVAPRAPPQTDARARAPPLNA